MKVIQGAVMVSLLCFVSAFAQVSGGFNPTSPVLEEIGLRASAQASKGSAGAGGLSCRLHRGVLNVENCGAVADGKWVAGGCGQISPSGCWTGTNNNAAINKAAVTLAAAGGGEMYFPPSGTNIWMIGSAVECTKPIAGAGGGENALVTLAPGITLEGAGRSTTTIMAEPGVASTAGCWMFGNSVNPTYNDNFKDLRLDGNEPTGPIHHDILHPDNGNSPESSAGWDGLGAIFIQPDDHSNSPLNLPAAVIDNDQFTGFTGGRYSNPALPKSMQAVLWFGPYGRVVVKNSSIYFNEDASAIFNQASDSLFQDLYMNQDGDWNAIPMTVELNTGTVKWIDDYWGGGYSTNYVGLGVQDSEFVGDTNDSPGPGIRSQCSSTVMGCGSNYQFYSSGDRNSSGDTILGGTATDTYMGYPAITFEGSSANNAVEGVTFGRLRNGPTPSYLVQEQGAARKTSVVGSVVEERPSVADFGFLGSTSFALANQGAANIYSGRFASTRPSDSAPLMKECGTAKFSSSATSSIVACPGVTPTSHCEVTWIGVPHNASLGYRASSGRIVVKASVSVTGNVSVACSAK